MAHDEIFLLFNFFQPTEIESLFLLSWVVSCEGGKWENVVKGNWRLNISHHHYRFHAPALTPNSYSKLNSPNDSTAQRQKIHFIDRLGRKYRKVEIWYKPPFNFLHRIKISSPSIHGEKSTAVVGKYFLSGKFKQKKTKLIQLCSWNKKVINARHSHSTCLLMFLQIVWLFHFFVNKKK